MAVRRTSGPTQFSYAHPLGGIAVAVGDEGTKNARADARAIAPAASLPVAAPPFPIGARYPGGRDARRYATITAGGDWRIAGGRKGGRMDNLGAALTGGMRELLANHPVLAIGGVIFVEELGVPSPLPSDLLMLLAGIGVRQGQYPFWLILLVQQLATLLGTCGLYAFTRRVGRGAFERYGWLLHIGPATLTRAEDALRHSGWRGVLIGRLVPGLRIVTPIAAGVLGVPFAQFFPAVAVGALIYILVFNALGYFVGAAALEAYERIGLPTGALFALVIVALIVFMVRNAKLELPALARGTSGAAVASRLDGLLAGLIALLATNGLVGVAAFAARPLGFDAPLGAEEVGTGLRFLLGGPVFLLTASVLGVIDEHLGTERLHWVVRSAVLAVIPLAATLLLALLAGRGIIPLATRGGGYLVAVEVVRWGVFGIALGEFLPLDGRLHQAEVEELRHG
jgi:membrane protein DedA with SNARE-associated domain